MKIHPLFPGPDPRPVMVTASTDQGAFVDRVAISKHEIDGLLGRHGAILFRGLGTHDAVAFQRCVETLGGSPFAYVGGDTPRRRVEADVFTSTEYPASEAISLHHEMSYLHRWPRRLFFACVQPALDGGQTPLAMSREVTECIPSRISDRFRDKGLVYVRHFHGKTPLGKSWMDTYQTDDPSEVEAIVNAQSSQCDWLPGDVLRVETRRDAFIDDVGGDRQDWFNQAEQWHPSALSPTLRGALEGALGADRLPHDCRYGDGESIDEGDLVQVREVLRRSRLLFEWQRGDLLMVDNRVAMHGREPFRGDRSVLAYLSAT